MSEKKFKPEATCILIQNNNNYLKYQQQITFTASYFRLKVLSKREFIKFRWMGCSQHISIVFINFSSFFILHYCKLNSIDVSLFIYLAVYDKIYSITWNKKRKKKNVLFLFPFLKQQSLKSCEWNTFMVRHRMS